MSSMKPEEMTQEEYDAAQQAAINTKPKKSWTEVDLRRISDVHTSEREAFFRKIYGKSVDEVAEICKRENISLGHHPLLIDFTGLLIKG